MSCHVDFNGYPPLPGTHKKEDGFAYEMLMKKMMTKFRRESKVERLKLGQ